MPFRHKTEYNISIGHNEIINCKIDVRDRKIFYTFIFAKEIDDYGKKISGIF